MTITHPDSSKRKTIDMGDGLIMRWSTKVDTDNVADLVSNCFRVCRGPRINESFPLHQNDHASQDSLLTLTLS